MDIPQADFFRRLVRHRFVALVIVLTALTGCQHFEKSQSESGDEGATNNPEQIYQIGSNYSNGIGVEQDYAKGLLYYRKSADAGYVPAMFMAGMSYSIGRGTPVNTTKAKFWLKKAAEAGHAGAQYKVGTMYLDGKGVTRDRAWGVRWLGMAAYQNHARAQFSLGVCWSTGIGVPVDKVRGLSWMMRARQQGHKQAKELYPVLVKTLGQQQIKQAEQRSMAGLPAIEGIENPPTIVFLQYRLSEKGFDSGTIDGQFGGKTRVAMRAFQKTAELPETDRVDGATLNALRELHFWERWIN